MIGKIICDLAPGKLNNRNSEGAFVKLKNGDLLFAYTRYRGGGHHDHSPADIYAVLSKNEGESFGESYLLFSCDEVGADNVMSVSFMRMKSGELGLFYLRKHNEKHLCVPYLALSSDEGTTWYKHIKCISEDGYYVLNNDRVITLDNGRILMPVARHEYKDNQFLPGSIYIYASDDNGQTWGRLSNKITINSETGRRKDFGGLHNCMEPGVVQLGNGDVWLYIRTEMGRQYEGYSKDFGRTWSCMQPSPFTSPDSPMCVKRLKSGELFTVWNPVPIHNGKSTFIGEAWTGARTPLVFTVLNECGDFSDNIKVIEDDENSGFCYCAIYETESGDILLGYCAGGVFEGSCLDRLRIRKISNSEIH